MDKITGLASLIGGGSESKVSSFPAVNREVLTACRTTGVCNRWDTTASFVISPSQLPSGIAAVLYIGNLTQRFGNKGMQPVLTFLAKINMAVLEQFCSHAGELFSRESLTLVCI